MTTAIDKYKHNYETPKEKVNLAIDKIRVARMEMLTHFRFYSILALNMQLRCLPIGTCATDGKSFIFDAEFICGASPEYIESQAAFDKLLHDQGVISNKDYKEKIKSLENWFSPKSTKELVFILLHEVRHLVNATLARMVGLDAKLMNKASDYNINNRLKSEINGSPNFTKGKFETEFPITKHCLLSNKYFDIEGGVYKEWTSEAIYLDLMENGEKGKGSSFDIHIEISEEQAEKIKSTIINTVKGLDAGDMPGDVLDAVNKWTEPKVHWATLFDRRLKSNVIHDYNYSQPATRSWMLTKELRKKGFLDPKQFYIQPSYEYECTIDAVLAFDTSGSISDDVKQKVLSEAVGIIKQFNQATLHLISWDTRVAGYDKYEHVTLEDVKGFRFKGGGGTDPDCVPNYLKEHKIKATSLVIFTDMCFDTDYEKFKQFENVIWVTFNSDIKAKVGKTIKYID